VNLTFTLYLLTLNLLTSTIVAPPSNASKWQMGFNSAFKGLNIHNMIFVQNMYSINFDIRKSEKARQIESNLPTERSSSN
jgi:hypothetical protein